MKEFKDIDRDDEFSRMFREGAEDLNPKPSFKAWDRLEHRLDSRRLRKRAVTYRYTSMIAAAVGLIGIIMFVQLLDKVGPALTPNATEEVAPFAEVENIGSLTDDERRIAEAIQLHKLEQKELQGELAESDSIGLYIVEPEIDAIADNNLSPAPKPAIVNPAKPVAVDDEEVDYLNEVEAEEEIDDLDFKKIEKEKAAKKELERQIRRDAENEAAKRKEEYKKLAQQQEKDINPPTKANENVSSPTASRVEAEKIVVREDNNYQGKEELTNSQGNPRDEVISYNNQPTTVKTETLSNAPVKQGRSKKSKASKELSQEVITKFSWMAGNWKDALGLNSFENWYISENYIMGEGYTKNDNKKNFKEYMKIYEKGGNIYLETSVDNSKKFKKFKLVNSSDQEYTFERKQNRFPNQIVIKRVSDAAYTIVYKDKNAKDLNDSQAKYFNQRNSISTRRASRSMNRY